MKINYKEHNMTRLTKPNKRDVKKSTNPPASTTVAISFDETVPPEVVVATLGKLTYRELQGIAKESGLKASGTKADLIARLA